MSHTVSGHGVSADGRSYLDSSRLIHARLRQLDTPVEQQPIPWDFRTRRNGPLHSRTIPKRLSLNSCKGGSSVYSPAGGVTAGKLLKTPGFGLSASVPSGPPRTADYRATDPFIFPK